jgi:hypothetical protein
MVPRRHCLLTHREQLLLVESEVWLQNTIGDQLKLIKVSFQP